MPRLEPPGLVVISSAFSKSPFFLLIYSQKPRHLWDSDWFFFGGSKNVLHDSAAVGPYRPQLLWNLGGRHARLAYSVVDGESWEWCNKQRDDGQLPGRKPHGCGNVARKWW